MLHTVQEKAFKKIYEEFLINERVTREIGKATGTNRLCGLRAQDSPTAHTHESLYARETTISDLNENFDALLPAYPQRKRHGVKRELIDTENGTLLDNLILKSKSEVRAASTIANNRQKIKLVTHRAEGGGGPYSRMMNTKFTRFEIKRQPTHQRGDSVQESEASNFGSLVSWGDNVRENREAGSTKAVARNKFFSLEITAKRVIPGKMYRLLPLVEDQQIKIGSACEQGTCTTPLPYSQELDGERQKTFAYKEGHFIPGQAVTKGFQQTAAEKDSAMSVILKQMQPKVLKLKRFHRLHHRAPAAVVNNQVGIKEMQAKHNSQDTIRGDTLVHNSAEKQRLLPAN